MTFFFLPRLSISTVVHALVSFPRSPRDSWTTIPRNATISRFSSRLLRETEPVGASLHEFDRRVFIRGWYVPVSRAASGSLRPPPSFPSSLANYASSRKKESGYYTRVLLVNSLFPPRDPICEECPRNSQSYVQISTFLAGNHILSPWSTIVGVRRGRERGGGKRGIIKLHYQQQILFSFYFLYIICFFDDRAKV